MWHESITTVANLVVHDGTYTVGATHMHVHGQQLQQATFEVAHATHVGSSEDCRCVQFVCAKECEFAQRVARGLGPSTLLACTRALQIGQTRVWDQC